MSKPFEVMTEQEKDMFIAYIEAYGGCDGESCYVDASAEHLLRFWNENKRNIFSAFGDKLILSKSVEVVKSKKILRDSVEAVKRNSQFYEELYNFARIYTYPHEKIKTVMDRGYPIGWAEERISNALDRDIPIYFKHYTAVEWDRLREAFSYLTSADALVDNIYDGPSCFIYTGPEDKDYIKITRGAKTIRILNKLAEVFDLPDFEEFRIAHSMCLNQKKMSGDLCLSIHPLDYITMSDNNYNWESCMSWRQGGEYRQGTVEMMNSPYVVCAYLRPHDLTYEMPQKTGSWTDKCWRCLYIVHPKAIASVRQYPCENKELNNQCMNWLYSIFANQEGYGPYTKESYEIEMPYGSIDNKLVPEWPEDIVAYIEFFTNKMYNDMYSTRLMYLWANPVHGESVEIDYSGESECMTCGGLMDEEASSLMCAYCNPTVECELCGERFSADNMYEINGALYCRYCYDEHACTCVKCSNIYIDDDMFEFSVENDEGDILESVSLCEDCASDYNDVADINVYSQYGSINVRYVPCCDMKNMFGFYDYMTNPEYSEYRAARREYLEENGMKLDKEFKEN